MEQKPPFHIAGRRIDIFSPQTEQLKRMLSGVAPFSVENENLSFNDLSLAFFVKESLDAFEGESEPEKKLIHSFTIEDRGCRLSREAEKYFFSIGDIRNRVSDTSENRLCSLKLEMKPGSKSIKCHCASLRCIHPGHLKSSLWMALAFIGISRQTVALQSSDVIYDNRAVLVLVELGTKKSTHTKLWLRYIVGSLLFNDDSPINRIESDKNNQLVPFNYRSPWSRKGQSYFDERSHVAAFGRLRQHKISQISRIGKMGAFEALIPSFPPAYLKDDYFEALIFGIISTIVIKTPVYSLQCLPDKSVAELL